MIIFFFNDTATTEIYTLSLHDALPISHVGVLVPAVYEDGEAGGDVLDADGAGCFVLVLAALAVPALSDDLKLRSEEHTSELQSRLHLVCRLLLEKKYCYQEHQVS